MSDKKTDYRDIKDLLDGSIPEVIERLRELHKQYPDGSIRIDTYCEYGETYPQAELTFTRDKTPIEIEREGWEAKRALYAELSEQARAFHANDVSFPRDAELKALREELGAFADTWGSLVIYENEVLTQNFEGAKRRDGSWVFRVMGFDRYSNETEREPANGVQTAPEGEN